jgi:hypothetical protein
MSPFRVSKGLKTVSRDFPPVTMTVIPRRLGVFSSGVRKKNENNIRKICGITRGGAINIETGLMKAGTYYVGDPTFVLGNPQTRAEVNDLHMKDTMDVLNRSHILPDGDVPGWTEAYAERVEDAAQIMAMEKQAEGQGKYTLRDGREIVIFDTAYGAGLYTDQNGRRYNVASRSICLTPTKGLHKTQHGNIVTFKEPFKCVSLVDSRPFSGKLLSGGRFTKLCFGNEAEISTEFSRQAL